MRFINLLSPSLARHEQQRLQRLLAVEKRIRHDGAGPLDWQEVSTSAAMSRFHFLRRFQRTFGTTPHQLLIRSRLERAKTFLRETDLSVTDICFEVGYESLGSFCTLFQRQVGCSPRAYRAQRPRHWSVEISFPPQLVPFCFQFMFGAAGAQKSNNREVFGTRRG